MEDRADNIIDELLVLGVLQKSSDRNGQQISSTSQEFCLVEADEQDFVAKAANLPAHAIIEDDGKNIPPSFQSLQIQSLFVITAQRRGLVNQGLSRVYIETLCGLQSLSLLDLDGVVEYLPDEVGDLVHLRYLGLANSKLQELPKTLANLQKLQTLDIRFCNLSVLPMEILNFQQLRHLLMEKELLSRAVTIPNGIGKLVNLHTCTGVFAGCGIFDEFSSLTQLRKFGVTCLSEDHASELFAAIMKMKNLTSLSLRSDTEACEGTFFPDMEQFSPPPLLQELHLDGRLFEMPQWLASMENLTTLFLSSSCLYENPTSVLQFLPKLQILTLWEAYQKKLICKEFCNAGGFPALQSLTIAAKYLVEWTEIANGAFPSLRCLSFNDCPNLMFLPEGLQNIKTLESLYLRKVHEDLVRRLMSVENYKVKHISDLKFK